MAAVAGRVAPAIVRRPVKTFPPWTWMSMPPSTVAVGAFDAEDPALTLWASPVRSHYRYAAVVRVGIGYDQA